MQNFEKMTRNELVVIAKNMSYQNERNEEKLKLLTGCAGFGDADPMDGSCVDCSYNDEAQWIKCEEFREKLHDVMKEKWEREKNEPKIEPVVLF